VDEEELELPQGARRGDLGQLRVESDQAFPLVVDRDDDADHGAETSDRAGCGTRGRTRDRAEAAASSPITQARRRASAATTAVSTPSAGSRVAMRIPSRTPSPPGRTATANPATVARATLAITSGQSLGSTPDDTNARTTATWLSPRSVQPAVEQTSPSASR